MNLNFMNQRVRNRQPGSVEFPAVSPLGIFVIGLFLGIATCVFPNKDDGVQASTKMMEAPTLLVWGTDDVYFDLKWSHWLAALIPETRRRIEFDGARIFFSEERCQEFNKVLRDHWQEVGQDAE